MDADVDSAWICTQAIVSRDSRLDDEQEKINNYGYIVLNDMIDNGRYILNEGDNTIGRHPLNHIYIEHPSVSMNHAVIQCDSDGVVLLDKGSLNKTKLNKKTLRKNVAYFLEENALLTFGEVQADYFMNEKSIEFENDTKSMAPDNTSVLTATQNDGHSSSKLSNAIMTPKYFRTDIPNAITDCNVPLVIENKSTCKIGKEVPKTITGTECTMNTHNDIHTKLNSSSPSDEYLLEALSQVEAKQNNENFNQIVHNLSNEDTLIMNLTKSVSEITREDTPSPVMDLKSSILTTNNILQSPSKINKELIREDTPSPIMDFGCCNDFENNLETNNYGINSTIQSLNEVDKFNNTQVLEIDKITAELNTHFSNNDDILFFEAHNVQSGEQSIIPTKNLLDNPSNDKLSGSNNINLSTNSHNIDEHKIIVNTFEADDDDIFRHFIKEEFKSQQHDLATLENQDFFNCPTQKVSIKKNIRTKVTSLVHDKETQNLKDISKSIKSNVSASKSIQEDLTEVPKIDDDFFNCPTQKLPTSKNIFPNIKICPSIHEEETQRPPEFSQFDKTNNIVSNDYSTNKHEDLTVIPEMDDDFFNCPTQKLSTTKKINPKSKLSSSIHKEETKELLEFSKPCKSNSIVSKSYSTSIHEENTQNPKIDDDFFNCPTQKVSITKNLNAKPKVSASIHEEETQRPLEFPQLNKTNTITSKTYSTNKHEDLSEVPEMDNDFFNCPTQKLSTTKKINPKSKLSSSIHNEETKELLEFSKPCKSNSIVSKSYSTSIHEGNTQNPKIDDDFFNCPTQKVSITKNLNAKPKVSPSIHEEETQRLLEFPQLNKTNNIVSNDYSTNKHEDLTEVPKIDDDFFNCPTQKLPTSKNIFPNIKICPSVHEEETQRPPDFSQFDKTNNIVSNDYSTNKHKDLTEVPVMDDDFFNCPTQKLSTTKKINPKSKLSSSIHNDETKEFLEFSKTFKSNSIVSKNYSTSVHKENTQNPNIDDDFFNCPTQKVSITKNLNAKPKVSASIHEEETQRPLEFPQLNKTNTITSKTDSTNKHEDLTEVSEMDDDFFNCPTQKVSITKNLNAQPKVSPSIHEEETQRPLEFPQLNKTNTITSKTYSTNKHEDLTEVPEMDDDFFNCPTQKVSITKNLNAQPKVSPSIHEEETQRPLEFPQLNKTNTITSKTYSTNKHEDLTEVPEIDDDFFNCPTQKVSITKNLNAQPKVSPSIHEEETQRPLEFPQLNKTNTITSKTYFTNKHEDLTEVSESDDNFFNCPTQKLTTTKKINPKIKVSSTVYEEETQELLKLHKPNKKTSSSSKSYTISKHEDSSQSPKIDDDFFNCPTQKLSTSKNIFPNIKICPSIHEEETQKPPEFSQFDKTNNIVSNDYSTNKHKDLTEDPEMDDNFFNCPTQKVPCNSNSKFTTNCKKHKSIPININEAETNDSLKQSNSKINLPSNIKQNKGNISVNSTSQKVLTKVQSKSISNCSVNINEDITKNHEHFDGLSSHKKIVVPDNKDRCKVQKSKFAKSNIISQSNVQLPVMCNENSSNNLRTNKQKIRVRKDLHKSYSGDSSNNSTNIVNKPNINTVFDNINTTVLFNENFDLPGCSKTTIIKKNDLNASASKQKCFIDNSDQSQVSSISLRYNNNMKQINESIFSPLNIPDISANSLLEDHSSPINFENNLNTLKCESYTSSNNAFEWKSFWNKKKVQSRDKGKSDKQKSIKIAPEVKENKERYQTRAITRKRKQNGFEESNKKLCNRSNILEPLVKNSSEIVVSFSYLKSRHLQEMKQFVEKTGGTVTDDITQCTVLVTDKIRCTMKILSAIAKGCPIVNANWLKHSYTVKMFQDVDDFIIADKDAERKYKFQLKESLAKAKTMRLLDGYNVLVTPSVKPGPLEMKVIITCAGGNFVLNWTTTQYTKELIVTCDKDRTRWKPAWDNNLAKIIDSDTLVKSIIRQQLTI